MSAEFSPNEGLLIKAFAFFSLLEDIELKGLVLREVILPSVL